MISDAARTPPLALLLLLFLAACAGGRTDTAPALPAPDSPTVDDAEPLYCPDFAPWEVEGSMEPPQFLNRDELLATLAARFRGVSEARRTVVTMRVTRTGEVDRLCMKTRSGSEAFDAAVMELAPRLRFEPGTIDGEPRSVSASVPFEING